MFSHVSVPVLADGRRLIRPIPTHPRSLAVGDWARVEGIPAQIADLRARTGGGRIVHFADRPPLALTERDTLDVYTVSPPTPAS